MGPRSQAFRLADILDAIAGIKATLAGATFETYSASWAMRRATERGIEIISEASRHIPQALKDSHPTMPWQDIAAIGNVLRHEYGHVEDRVIWEVTQKHLDDLERAVRAMLGANKA